MGLELDLPEIRHCWTWQPISDNIYGLPVEAITPAQAEGYGPWVLAVEEWQLGNGGIIFRWSAKKLKALKPPYKPTGKCIDCGKVTSKPYELLCDGCQTDRFGNNGE